MYPMKLQILPINKLRTDRDNPRIISELFDDRNVFFRSIRDDGVMVPIAVSDMEDGTYLIVDGNRRFMCARALRYDTLPCRVYPRLSPGEIQTRRFIANTTVKDLTKDEKRRQLQRPRRMGATIDACDGD